MNDPNTNPSQAKLVLAKLQEFPNQWVPMPLLAEVSDAYAVHSRISELRKIGREAGFFVDNKKESIPGSRKRKSFYRYRENVREEATA
jgi:hypothetical protein